MAWQKNVRVIVMLTNLIEGLGFNANKCSQYWPDMVGSSRRYQDIDVQLYDRQEAPDYLGRHEPWRFTLFSKLLSFDVGTLLLEKVIVVHIQKLLPVIIPLASEMPAQYYLDKLKLLAPMHLNAFKVSSFRHCNGEYAIYISFYNGDKQYFKSEYVYHLYNSMESF